MQETEWQVKQKTAYISLYQLDILKGTGDPHEGLNLERISLHSETKGAIRFCTRKREKHSPLTDEILDSPYQFFSSFCS